MVTPRSLLPTLLLLAAFVLSGASRAAATVPPSALCAAHTMAKTVEEGMPEHMLTAISLVESGRWDKDIQARVAWPWTIMAEGRGRYFPTKAQAMAEVRQLQARGIRNIDVGCMQINMHYHGDAFANLEEALDPSANVAYAATFLKRLYAETKDWATAVTAYHSRTPEHAQRYAAKIGEAWAEARDSAARRVQLASLARDAVPGAGKILPGVAGSYRVLANPHLGTYYTMQKKERLVRYNAQAAKAAKEALAIAREIDAAYKARMTDVRDTAAQQEAEAERFAADWRARKMEEYMARKQGRSGS